MPYDDKHEESGVETFEAKSGDRINYINFAGRKKRTFRYKTNDVDEIAAIDRLWKFTSHGTGSFLYEQATDWVSNANPPAFYRANEPVFMMPISWGANGRDWEFSFTEMPPYQSQGVA